MLKNFQTFILLTVWNLPSTCSTCCLHFRFEMPLATGLARWSSGKTSALARQRLWLEPHSSDLPVDFAVSGKECLKVLGLCQHPVRHIMRMVWYIGFIHVTAFLSCSLHFFDDCNLFQSCYCIFLPSLMLHACAWGLRRFSLIFSLYPSSRWRSQDHECAKDLPLFSAKTK